MSDWRHIFDLIKPSAQHGAMEGMAAVPTCEGLQAEQRGNEMPHLRIFCLLAALFSEKVRNMSPDEIRIPPEPPGRCSSKLQVGMSPLAF